MHEEIFANRPHERGKMCLRFGVRKAQLARIGAAINRHFPLALRGN
ncbi:hypothetical protein [Paracoccus halophilus]|nr:hypothetical protein [Paracoccus halophilus]